MILLPGGAFKTMPISPKVIMGTDSGDIYSGGSAKAMKMETDSQSPFCHKTIPSIFTFNQMPAMQEHEPAHTVSTSELESNGVGEHPSATYLSHFGKGKAQPHQLVAIQLIDSNAKPSLKTIVKIADHQIIPNVQIAIKPSAVASPSISTIISSSTNNITCSSSNTTKTTTTPSTTSMSSFIINSDLTTTNSTNKHNDHLKSSQWQMTAMPLDEGDTTDTTAEAHDDFEEDHYDDFDEKPNTAQSPTSPPSVTYKTIQIEQPFSKTNLRISVKPTTINSNAGGIMVLTQATLSEILNCGGRININTINNNSTNSEQPNQTQTNKPTHHLLHHLHSKQHPNLMINSGSLHNHAVAAAVNNNATSANAISSQKPIMFAINNNVSQNIHSEYDNEYFNINVFFFYVKMAFGIPSTTDDHQSTSSPYHLKNTNNNITSTVLSNGQRHGAVKMFATSYGGPGSPYANLSSSGGGAQKTPNSLHYVISKVPNLLISGGVQNYDSAVNLISS